MRLTWKKLAVLAMASLAVVSAAGCSEGKQAKEHMLQALRKQAEIRSYSFEGRAELQLSETLRASEMTGDPLTGLLVQSLTASQLRWSGTAQVEPLRLESKLSVAPASGIGQLDVPILIKDTKMYMQIPLLNPKNEYVSMDLGGKSANLSQSSRLLADQTAALLEAIDSKWFASTTSSGDRPAIYTIDIKADNAGPISAQLKLQLPEWIDRLASAGLVGQPQAKALKASIADQTLKIQPPRLIRLVAGADGYVSELQTDISYTLEANGTTTPLQRLALSNQWSRINETPAFNQDIPATAKPLEELLKPVSK
ncbi:hypothetical protein [Paenibacillus koleovorans]|uniref:hypothetical protein n=1 Tax=Paenibacillus koleovorans TaxID=121608 RepID=UPI000FDB1795|nr:hypothetical protein [Paenibacillus koleovorans]